MINPELLGLIRCPETHQVIELAPPTLIEALNQKIAAAQLRNRAGQPVAERIDGGLIRSDKKFLYPIRHDIPIMLIDEAIPLPGA
ncbi:MAG: Trm112 family protein [Verrucomicrobia bacterium]|nr:Trm112 family protein [Verrucomicrobiota bacterium]